MNHPAKPIKPNVIVLVFWILVFYPLFNESAGIKAQDPVMLDSVLNELFFDEPDLYDLFDGNTHFHFLYAGTTINTATYYVGREIGDNFANNSTQLYYFISNGLYFGASGAWYSHLNPSLRSTVISAGFSNAPKWFKHLRYRISADRFIYLNMGTDFEPNYTSDFSTGLTLRNKWIGIRGDYTLLMGKSYSNLIATDIFAKIKILSLGGYDRIQFEPEISWSYGTETVEYDLNAHLANDPFYEPNYALRNDFGLMNTQLTIPLNIGYRNFDLEIAYLHHFPRSLDPAYYYDKSAFWRFSLAYIISIN